LQRPPISILFPYTTLFRSAIVGGLVSFPIAVLAGFSIGIVEEIVRHYGGQIDAKLFTGAPEVVTLGAVIVVLAMRPKWIFRGIRSEEHTSELQSQSNLVCR